MKKNIAQKIEELLQEKVSQLESLAMDEKLKKEPYDRIRNEINMYKEAKTEFRDLLNYIKGQNEYLRGIYEQDYELS